MCCPPWLQAAELAAPLGKLVLEGCAKAAARLDGLLALTAVGCIAGADLKADEALAADKARAACMQHMQHMLIIGSDASLHRIVPLPSTHTPHPHTHDAAVAGLCASGRGSCCLWAEQPLRELRPNRPDPLGALDALPRLSSSPPPQHSCPSILANPCNIVFMGFLHWRLMLPACASPSPFCGCCHPGAALQVWEAACSPDSPLLAPGTAARLAPEDAGAAAEAVEVLLTQVSTFPLSVFVLDALLAAISVPC